MDFFMIENGAAFFRQFIQIKGCRFLMNIPCWTISLVRLCLTSV